MKNTNSSSKARLSRRELLARQAANREKDDEKRRRRMRNGVGTNSSSSQDERTEQVDLSKELVELRIDESAAKAAEDSEIAQESGSRADLAELPVDRAIWVDAIAQARQLVIEAGARQPFEAHAKLAPNFMDGTPRKFRLDGETPLWIREALGE